MRDPGNEVGCEYEFQWDEFHVFIMCMVISGKMFRNSSLSLHTLTCNQSCYKNFEKIYTSLFSINFFLVLLFWTV